MTAPPRWPRRRRRWSSMAAYFRRCHHRSHRPGHTTVSSHSWRCIAWRARGGIAPPIEELAAMVTRRACRLLLRNPRQRGAAAARLL